MIKYTQHICSDTFYVPVGTSLGVEKAASMGHRWGAVLGGDSYPHNYANDAD